jgi:hypothetical protein
LTRKENPGDGVGFQLRRFLGRSMRTHPVLDVYSDSQAFQELGIRALPTLAE